MKTRPHLALFVSDAERFEKRLYAIVGTTERRRECYNKTNAERLAILSRHILELAAYEVQMSPAE